MAVKRRADNKPSWQQRLEAQASRRATVCSLYGCVWRSDTKLAAFETAVETWQQLGLSIDSAGACGAGTHGQYGPFRDLEPRVKANGYHGVDLVHFADCTGGEFTDWSACTAIMGRTEMAEIGFIPVELRVDVHAAFDAMAQELARLSNARVGCVFQQTMDLCPRAYSIGKDWYSHGLTRHDDLRENTSCWPCNRQSEGIHNAGIIRDVYPRSFLSRPYLDAPFGKTGKSLEAWIREDASRRGTLAPYTAQLTEWAPPVERIPALREELYRAGRLFYWRFFDPSDAMYRTPESLREPWEAPEPIPEIYRESFYADKDPGLVY